MLTTESDKRLKEFEECRRELEMKEKQAETHPTFVEKNKLFSRSNCSYFLYYVLIIILLLLPIMHLMHIYIYIFLYYFHVVSARRY